MLKMLKAVVIVWYFVSSIYQSLLQAIFCLCSYGECPDTTCYKIVLDDLELDYL